MSGQLVIAELQAFRAVLKKATRAESETIKVWSRSTIANALHRVGPTNAMKAAAERAWAEADAFADRMAGGVLTDVEIDAARDKPLASLDALIATVRTTKTALPIDGHHDE